MCPPPPQIPPPAHLKNFVNIGTILRNQNPQVQHMNKEEIHHPPMLVRVPTSEVQNFEDITPSFGLRRNPIYILLCFWSAPPAPAPHDTHT